MSNRRRENGVAMGPCNGSSRRLAVWLFGVIAFPCTAHLLAVRDITKTGCPAGYKINLAHARASLIILLN